MSLPFPLNMVFEEVPDAKAQAKEAKRKAEEAYQAVCVKAGQRLDRDAVDFLLARGDSHMNIIATLINFR